MSESTREPTVEPESVPVPEPDDEVLVAELVESELLVEEVSIDGMCGVY
jgi:mycofactocin precursor